MSTLRTPGPDDILCQCGETFQSRSGWDAQGLFTDLDDCSGIKNHYEAPKKCWVYP